MHATTQPSREETINSIREMLIALCGEDLEKKLAKTHPANHIGILHSAMLAKKYIRTEDSLRVAMNLKSPIPIVPPGLQAAYAELQAHSPATATAPALAAETITPPPYLPEPEVLAPEVALMHKICKLALIGAALTPEDEIDAKAGAALCKLGLKGGGRLIEPEQIRRMAIDPDYLQDPEFMKSMLDGFDSYHAKRKSAIKQ